MPQPTIYRASYDSPLGTIFLRSDGDTLTGYGGGIKNKIALLTLEGNDMSRFSVPTRGTAL